MEKDKLSSRRNYSAQFRALVLEQCMSPGASVAEVALSHGMNANVVHR
jgi:transposase